MSHQYEVMRVGPNQDVARLINQFVSQKEMRLVTSVSRGAGTEFIFEPTDKPVDQTVSETAADALHSAFRMRAADQDHYDAGVANERVADDQRRRHADALIAAMGPAEMKELRERATVSLPPMCRGTSAMVTSRMRELVATSGTSPV